MKWANYAQKKILPSGDKLKKLCRKVRAPHRMLTMAVAYEGQQHIPPRAWNGCHATISELLCGLR